MTYPRAIALSQALWCTEKPDYNSFCEILYGTHFDRLSALGVNYSKTSQKPLVKFRGQNDGISIELQTNDPKEQFSTIVHSSDCKANLLFDLLPNQPLIIERTKHKLIKSEFSFTSRKNGLKTEVKIKNHLGLGVPIQYITPPNPQYNYSPTILVDGQMGSRPWRGHEWVGFDTSQIQFEINLLKKRKVHFIELSFLNSNGSWIYLPQSIEIRKTSKRNRKVYQLKNITSESVQIRIGKRMKKIRINIRNHSKIPDGLPGSGHTPWTFIDEIIIK
jgi:hexosaminidase